MYKIQRRLKPKRTFMCNQCKQIFKTRLTYARHIQIGHVQNITQSNTKLVPVHFQGSVESWFDSEGLFDDLDQEDNELLLLQRRLITMIEPHTADPFNMYKVKDLLSEQMIDSSWLHYLEIYSFMNATSLSQKEGNMLLHLITGIMAREKVYTPLGKGSETIKHAVLKTVLAEFQSIYFEFKLPPFIFSEKMYSFQQVAFGYHLNIMQILAEMLADINVDDFHFKPYQLFTDEGDKIYREPATAEVFKHYCEIIEKNVGGDAIPLAIVVSGDSLILNKTGTFRIYAISID